MYERAESCFSFHDNDYDEVFVSRNDKRKTRVEECGQWHATGKVVIAVECASRGSILKLPRELL